MSPVRPIGLQNEIVVPLLVPYFAKKGDEIVAAVPELEAHLKAKYPRVKEVRFSYRNPRPDLAAESLTYLHEASVVIWLVGGIFTKKMTDLFAEDAYKWLKKRFKKIRKGRKRHRRPHRT